MQCIIDAPVLLRALKQINIRSHMHPFVQLQVQDGKLTLVTCTEVPSPWNTRTFPTVRASVSITEALAIVEEGRYSVRFQALLNAVSLFDGPITLRREERAVIVERVDELKHQTPIEGTGDFPPVAPTPDAGMTNNKKESVWETCPTCGSRPRHEQVDVYQVNGVTIQRMRIEQERLSSMFKQVAWAVGHDSSVQGYIGVYLEMKDGVLLLQARDGNSVAQRREPLTEAENWDYGVLIPAKQLERVLQLIPKKTVVRVETVLVQYQHIKRDEQAVPDAIPFVKAREIRFSTDEMVITLRLFNDEVPDYQEFFAQVRASHVICETADVLNACTAVSKVAEESNSLTWFRVNETGISLETKNGVSSIPALHQVKVLTKEGDDSSVATSWWYLREAFKAITATQVRIELSEPGNPLVLRSADGQDAFRCAVPTVKVSA